MSDLKQVLDTVNNIANESTLTELSNWEEQLRFLGIKVINVIDFSELVVRLLLNVFVIFIVVQYMYARNSQRKDFYFSYLAVGSVVFLLSFLLNSVKLELGFALGLFAIFGIIRYRTDAIPIKEMTYLFVVIGISVINALANKKVSYVELIFTNAAIVSIMWILEKTFMLRQEVVTRIIYEKIENIHLMSKSELMADIKERTGISPKRIEITEINFLRDIAKINVYHNANDSKNRVEKE